ncbi:glycosyltransferase family 2 protein [Pseudoflavonifractor phocaeensis]|uniref:glycosyltransferase family 2 protein n=1 Tax=Pseudoflavonifractor phocaeensis TaxID=1870988 RepID=UPI001F409A58|nr:glycosyltransferase family A protein [Pseudoflavonifractor phocaeensis]MCF2595524.1 glycosyltransferase family 2 protein [Pseudoflavonifractor phocaeensis]
MPLVSVVMPAYNAEKYVEAAIRSVLAQTFPEFELLVVDDCSRDRTAEIIQRLARQDSRVVFLQNPKNSGVAATRNYAISQAKGEWVAFLDSDDLWRADKLEKQLALLRGHPDGVLAYTASAFIDQDGKPYSYIMEAQPEVSYQTLLRRNLLSCSSVMVKTEVIRRYPMGHDGMHEDYTTWLQILRETRCAYGVNEPLLIYRLSPNSKSSGRVKSAKMLYRSYRYVGYGCMTAACLVFRYFFYSVRKRRKIAVSKQDMPSGAEAPTREEG